MRWFPGNPDKSKNKHTQPPVRGKMWRCTKCNRGVPEKFKVCPYCG